MKRRFVSWHAAQEDTHTKTRFGDEDARLSILACVLLLYSSNRLRLGDYGVIPSFSSHNGQIASEPFSKVLGV